MKAMAYSNWQGSWKKGSGTLSTDTNVLKSVPYTYASRFEGASGGSPEELLAVAHAGCFNQALANNFDKLGLEAASIETSVEIDFGIGDDGSPAIKSSHITVTAKAPNATQAQFDHCAERARANCTVSKVLKCDITMTSTFVTS